MKHGKKPTVAQRRLIKNMGLNWENWLVERDTPEKLVVLHKLTEQRREIHK